MIDLEAFRRWLDQQGYQPTTVAASVRDARRLCLLLEQGAPVHPRLRTVAAQEEMSYLSR